MSSALVYLGVGFLVIAIQSAAQLAIEPNHALPAFIIVGIFAMGIVLALIGLSVKKDSDANESPVLRHALATFESSNMHLRSSEGNRALAIVLVSLGLFILGVPSALALLSLDRLSISDFVSGFMTSPIFSFGVLSTVAGISLRRRCSRTWFGANVMA